MLSSVAVLAYEGGSTSGLGVTAEVFGRVDRGGRVLSQCTGAGLLAAAWLLDGRRN